MMLVYTEKNPLRFLNRFGVLVPTCHICDITVRLIYLMLLLAGAGILPDTPEFSCTCDMCVLKESLPGLYMASCISSALGRYRR